MVLGYSLIATLGIVIYIITTTIAGKWWALLAATLVLGNSVIISAANENALMILGAITAIVAIGCFAQFIEKPSRTLLLGSSAMLGVAMAIHQDGIVLLPTYIVLLAIHLVATMIRDWNETDENMRRNRFYVRTVHYVRAGIIIISIGILFFYSIATMQALHATSTTTTNNFLVNWMVDNPALRPIGLQALQLIANRRATQTLADTPGTWSLIVIALFVGAFIAFRIAKKLHHPVDELTLHYTEWILSIFLVIFAALHYNKFPDYILLTTIPLFAILAAESIKTWFTNEDPALHRNLHINIVLTERARLTIALKTAALVALLAWYLVENLFGFAF